MARKRWMSRLAQLGRKPMRGYKDFRIGCAPGTHEALAEMVMAHVEKRSGVLDLGAHSGAMLARLRDLGFDDLAGADLNLQEFRLVDVPIQRIDLNTDFAPILGRKFGLICSTDVIEHVNSPRHFLSQAHELLTDGGYLAVSMPNVAFWEGRLKFAITGELWGFGARNYRNQRHISPMTRETFQMTLRELGFRVIVTRTAGSFAGFWRRLLTSPLWLPMRLLGGPTALGECLVILARKIEPDLSLTRPVHYDEPWRRSEQHKEE